MGKSNHQSYSEFVVNVITIGYFLHLSNIYLPTINLPFFCMMIRICNESFGYRRHTWKIYGHNFSSRIIFGRDFVQLFQILIQKIMYPVIFIITMRFRYLYPCIWFCTAQTFIIISVRKKQRLTHKCKVTSVSAMTWTKARHILITEISVSRYPKNLESSKSFVFVLIDPTTK